MTRAKDRLYLIHAHHRSTWGVGAASEASRFLAELPEELLATEREESTPFRRSWGAQGGWQRRGTDDDEWLPGGYRAPGRRVQETLHPVTAEIAFHAGDHVRHRRFGEGIVVSSRLEKGDEWVTVAFVGQGVKELIAAYAGLERT